MTKSSIWWSLAFAMVLGVTGCGDEGGPSGAGASGGSGATGGGGSGGAGGSVGGDCARICESPCVGEYLPSGAIDDCERSCAMGFFTCVPELIAALDCIEALGCDSGGGSPACLDESEAFTSCVLP